MLKHRRVPPGPGVTRPARPNIVALIVLLTITACVGSEPSASSSLPTSTTSTTMQRSTTTTAMSSTTTMESASTTSTVEEGPVEVRVEGGAVVAGPGELRVDLGSDVRIVVVTDTADHIHVHGYDLFFDTSPGEEIEIEFVADVPGIFEIELEDSGLLLLQLEVS